MLQWTWMWDGGIGRVTTAWLSAPDIMNPGAISRGNGTPQMMLPGVGVA